jgi:hypothetical protein
LGFLITISCAVKPTDEIIIVKGNFWLVTKEKCPLESVTVPDEVPFMEMLALGTDSRLLLITWPLNKTDPFNCAFVNTGIKNTKVNIFFMLLCSD